MYLSSKWKQGNDPTKSANPTIGVRVSKQVDKLCFDTKSSRTYFCCKATVLLTVQLALIVKLHLTFQPKDFGTRDSFDKKFLCEGHESSSNYQRRSAASVATEAMRKSGKK